MHGAPLGFHRGENARLTQKKQARRVSRTTARIAAAASKSTHSYPLGRPIRLLETALMAEPRLMKR